MVRSERFNFGSLLTERVVAAYPCLSNTHVMWHVAIVSGTHQAKFNQLWRWDLPDAFCLHVRHHHDRIPSTLPLISFSPYQTVTMGRLHSNGKGISASAVPYSRNPPSWLKTTPEQVVDQICKLAKKGATPSQIGVVLRDSHGIAQVKVVTGM